MASAQPGRRNYNLVRGDYAAARRTLVAAQKADPQNAFVQNNLALLSEAEAAKTWRPAGGG